MDALRSGAAVEPELFEEHLRNGWLWLRPEGAPQSNENFEELTDDAAQLVSIVSLPPHTCALSAE